MAWFDSRTVFLSASLFFLPLLVLCAVLCLPLLIFVIITLYLVAWITYLFYAQSDAHFSLPYNPARIIKVNLAVLDLILGWVYDIPIIIAYLQWRYWHIGTEKFRHIVTRDITYSDADTLCKLDVYHPEKKNNQRASPIVVFIYGGSWSSGAKYLYTPFANTLRELGYVVVVPDYRKYPKVKIDGMYDDVRQVIKWTYKHAGEIDGDVEMLYVMGHSAGAHLASQVVLGDAIEKANFLKAKNGPSEKRDPSTKSASYTLTDLSAPLQKDFLPQVEGLILMAGVYAVDQHLLYETSRGVEKISAMARVMGSTVEGYCSNSPLDLVKRNGELFAFNDDILDFAPRILFVHGERDTVVPKEQSIDMYNMLGDVLPPERRDEVDVRMRLYKRLGHAQCILDLMPSILPASRLRKSLIRDFQEFMDY